MTTPPPRPTPTVLLVDDDDFLRELMTEMLSQLGVSTVYQAGNGLQALATLKELPSPPDLLICDVYMPDMDGIEFVSALAAQGYTGGVVILSGVNPEMLQLARDLARGVGLHLLGAYLKPATPDMLADALGRLPA